MDRVHKNFTVLHAYVEYENPDDAEKAVKYMNGGNGSTLLSVNLNFKLSMGILALQIHFPWMNIYFPKIIIGQFSLNLKYWF